jgi:hypothetical protein
MVDQLSGSILLCADTDEVEKYMLTLLPQYNDKACALLSVVIGIAYAREKDHENRAKLKRALEVIACETDVPLNTESYEVSGVFSTQS